MTFSGHINFNESRISLAASVVIQCLEIKARIGIQAFSWAENVFSWKALLSLSSGKSSEWLSVSESSISSEESTRNYDIII